MRTTITLFDMFVRQRIPDCFRNVLLLMLENVTYVYDKSLMSPRWSYLTKNQVYLTVEYLNTQCVNCPMYIHIDTTFTTVKFTNPLTLHPQLSNLQIHWHDIHNCPFYKPIDTTFTTVQFTNPLTRHSRYSLIILKYLCTTKHHLFQYPFIYLALVMAT